MLCPLLRSPVGFGCSGLLRGAPGKSTLISSFSVARPFPLSSLGSAGEDSPLFRLWISMLTLLGKDILFVSSELPLLSTCRLALVDPECRLRRCSGRDNSGPSPPTPPSCRDCPSHGSESGTATTALSSSGDLFLRRASYLLCDACVRFLGVELVGFHSLPALGLRVGVAPILAPVFARYRKGVWFPPPMRAFRRLQRVGLVTRTCGSGVEREGMGEG